MSCSIPPEADEFEAHKQDSKVSLRLLVLEYSPNLWLSSSLVSCSKPSLVYTAGEKLRLVRHCSASSSWRDGRTSLPLRGGNLAVTSGLEATIQQSAPVLNSALLSPPYAPNDADKCEEKCNLLNAVRPLHQELKPKAFFSNFLTL